MVSKVGGLGGGGAAAAGSAGAWACAQEASISALASIANLLKFMVFSRDLIVMSGRFCASSDANTADRHGIPTAAIRQHGAERARQKLFSLAVIRLLRVYRHQQLASHLSQRRYAEQRHVAVDFILQELDCMTHADVAADSSREKEGAADEDELRAQRERFQYI